MSSNTTITIAGFTGKMARLITTFLLQNHSNVRIHGICRSIDKVPAALRSNPSITLFQTTSTDTPGLRRALAGASVCICAYLGDDTLMIDGQKTLIDACIAEDVPRYIASDWSFDFRGLKFGDHPAKDPMKYVQEYLEEKESEGKIKGVHVLNGAFMQVVWAKFLGYVDAEKGMFQHFGTGDELLEMTTYEDAAAFTADVAVDPNTNGFLKFLGDRKSVKELAQLYEKQYEMKPSVQGLGSLDDLYVKMQAAFKSEPKNHFAWMGMFYQYYMQNGSTSLGTVDNERYPAVQPLTVEKFLKVHTQETLGKSAFF